MKQVKCILCVFFLCLLCDSVVRFSSASAADWPTARGNAQRTGCIDGQAGPVAPKVLWAFKSQDHFIASPVPADDRLLVAGLGGFNAPSLVALPLEPQGAPAPAWVRAGQLLSLPVVSSPAFADGKLVFGDGMHQNNGGALHCFTKDGFPLWELPVPGELVHLEGAPTLMGSRVFIGGGAAGVLCIERDRATLDGQELDVAGLRRALDAKWKELLAKYEEEKKTNPTFAVKPTEDKLPRPAPVRVWQAGAEKWHVDAPVNVIGDGVLVASAFLDMEKVGDRALHCLDAATGKPRWRQALLFNPWGGANMGDFAS
jgi:outer membrane protein assembly factor BamB